MGQRDEKDKTKSRKEKLADYFYDLSKLIFAALVLGGMAPILTDSFNPIYVVMIIIGLASTYVILHIWQIEY